MKTIFPLQVVAFETDYGGVVSNTRYLEFIERARYHLFGEAGIVIAEVWENWGAQPVVRRVEIEFLGFAGHQDELEIEIAVVEHSKTTTTLKYECRRIKDGLVTMRATQTLAYVNQNWRPTRVPEGFRLALPIE